MSENNIDSDTDSSGQKCWACDRALGETLDLTNDEIDALYEHLMETEQEAPQHIAQHLSAILDQLPQHEILTRDPPAELRAELLMNRPQGRSATMSNESSADGKERSRDVCPACGCIGRFVGESAHGGPSVGHGSPRYVEHYECMAENCDKEWSA